MDSLEKSIDDLFDFINISMDKICGFLFGSLLEDDE